MKYKQVNNNSNYKITLKNEIFATNTHYLLDKNVQNMQK